MERITFYITFDVLGSNNAITGYTINSEVVKSAVESILKQLLNNDIDFNIEEFDYNKILNDLLRIDTEYTLENILVIDNDDTFMKWLIQDYNKNHLIQLSEKYLSSCFQCRINKVDLVPPKNLVIKYYYD